MQMLQTRTFWQGFARGFTSWINLFETTKPTRASLDPIEVLAESIYYASAERNGFLFIDTYRKAPTKTKELCRRLAADTLANEQEWRRGPAPPPQAKGD